jgi:predicted nucleotidyltransferase
VIDNQDIIDFVKLLNEKGVRYLLVGGYAVIHYAEPRYTKDIDFFVEPSLDNAHKILSVLVEFGLPESAVKLELFTTEGNFFKLGRPPWRIDLITSLEGVDFESLLLNSTTTRIHDQEVKIVSREDLITIKTIAGRPQDLLDIESLKK